MAHSHLVSANEEIANDDAGTVVHPDVALSKLKAGNARFVAEPLSRQKPTAQRRVETAHGQHPYAVMIACSDSRTPPELIFDQNIGDLFVIRTAGNLVDDHGLGGIEYAVSHLDVRLVVVLGHQRCGAIGAALASPTAPGHIQSLIRDILPAINAAKNEPGDQLTHTAKANARLVAEKIRREANFGPHQPDVRVITGYYNLDTGEVQWPADVQTT